MKRRLFIIYIGLITIWNLPVSAQNENDRRILVADLSTKENMPFIRQGVEFSRILAGAAMDDQLLVYYFKDLNSAPTTLSTAQFMSNMETPDYYEAWDREYDYTEFEMITFNDNLYVARLSDTNIGNQPDISGEFWEKVEKSYYFPSDLSLIKLDEQYLNNEWHLQFIHLFVAAEYTESGVAKYVGSFSAREAIAALNNSGNVWYTQLEPNSGSPAPMGHIIGKVYLSNYDNSALESLIENGYPLNKKVTEIITRSTYPGEKVNVLYNYDELGIDSIYITKQNSSELIDSMVFELQGEKNSEMYRIGDALLLDLLKSNEQKEQLVAHKTFQREKSKGRLKKKVETTIRERIDFRVFNNNEHSSLLNLMVEDIIGATKNGTFALFEAQSLFDSELLFQKVEEPFIAENVDLYVEDPEPFDPNYTYGQYQTVSFEGLSYVSQKDINKGNIPAFNPQDWQQIEMDKAYYSPDVIKVLDIDYQLIFKKTGKIKRKKSKKIALLVPGQYTLEGVNSNLGSIDFKALETYAKKNRKPWLELLQSIKSQETFRFQMLDYIPIAEYKR